MTTTEMLASVEAQIRKDIPRLMELREGCILMKRDTDYNPVYRKIVFVEKNTYYIPCQCFGVKILQFSKENIIKKYKIIGHDIMLNDWFEWLCGLNNDDNETYYILTDNVLSVYNPLTDEQKDIVIELSKPYLRDQPEELIKFLYNLKNK